jgi:phosphopantetheine adenylyltransferase
MAHFRENKKDINLVVGAISLIAVMVVVSIAVDAWTGKAAQVFQVEELTISSFTFSGGNVIDAVVENNGTAPSEIVEVWINNEKQLFTANSTNGVISPKASVKISIFYDYSNGTSYHIKMVSARGNTQLFTATAL